MSIPAKNVHSSNGLFPFRFHTLSPPFLALHLATRMKSLMTNQFDDIRTFLTLHFIASFVWYLRCTEKKTLIYGEHMSFRLFYYYILYILLHVHIMLYCFTRNESNVPHTWNVKDLSNVFCMLPFNSQIKLVHRQ